MRVTRLSERDRVARPWEEPRRRDGNEHRAPDASPRGWPFPVGASGRAVLRCPRARLERDRRRAGLHRPRRGVGHGFRVAARSEPDRAAGAGRGARRQDGARPERGVGARRPDHGRAAARPRAGLPRRAGDGRREAGRVPRGVARLVRPRRRRARLVRGLRARGGDPDREGKCGPQGRVAVRTVPGPRRRRRAAGRAGHRATGGARSARARPPRG